MRASLPVLLLEGEGRTGGRGISGSPPSGSYPLYTSIHFFILSYRHINRDLYLNLLNVLYLNLLNVIKDR